MTVLALASVLDIRAAEPLQTSLMALRGQAVTLDASQVERLGGLCLQVLVSAQRTWAADGQSLTLAPDSAAFSEQWTAFGAAPLAEALGEPA
ncbi:STAS domain-containing protein [Brevundimonas lenta]|uniref:Chemotaxis protein CheX n=1 Tax=Brevundimonas lenta TaxID=424796 RepID=A0A7W6JA82_9CAUL|nr:STAS domain-containing protein [Brevundimonas lenta]MBB4081398.1 chemotaxis protein CheX [Brevundimonas lenta]